MGDEARRRILERRARFVAAALATAGVAAFDATGCKEEPKDEPYRIRSSEEETKRPPHACLKVAPKEEDAEPTAKPVPCLSKPWTPPPDAGPTPTAHPCLSPKPPPADGGM